MQHAYWRTKGPNKLPTLLRRTGHPAAADVRGVAGLLPGGPSVPGSRPRLRLQPGAFRVLCHQFRRDPDPEFFVVAPHGPRTQPKKTQALDLVVQLRKQNHSVYEISEALKDQGTPLSPRPCARCSALKALPRCPRRLDEELPARLGPTPEPVADVRAFTLSPGTQFTTQCGGLFLFLPDLVRLQVESLATAAKLPGSAMIPAGHALRAALALKLWAVERKSHVMALVADPGLALFCGLNAIPKKSYLSEYSSRLAHTHTTRLLAAWHRAVTPDALFGGESFNLDFHSVPYYGDASPIERHYVSMRRPPPVEYPRVPGPRRRGARVLLL